MLMQASKIDQVIVLMHISNLHNMCVFKVANLNHN